MKLFATLFEQLDRTNSTHQKVKYLAQYFTSAKDEDKIWVIALLSHKRPKRTVSTTLLRSWAAEISGIPLWLFEESYHIVGDLAETIALLTPSTNTNIDERSLSDWMTALNDLQKKSEEEKKEFILAAWNQFSYRQKFVFNKLITGGFRMGVSQKLTVKALSKATGHSENVLMHKMMGNWNPAQITFDELFYSDHENQSLSQPYPFFLAYALEEEVSELGFPEEWQAERKWDGIRGQFIKRNNEIFVWTRGEELVTDKFPELDQLKTILMDGFVLDGEILPFKDGKPLAFQKLQTRIGRKSVSKKILEEVPVILMAYDLLEYEGKDIREFPLKERRKLLEKLVETIQSPTIQISELIPFTDWNEVAIARDHSRTFNTEGLMLKHQKSTYQSGRKRGDWWKWKVNPLTIDAVLLYAMQGHGRRANLFTDYTFAVWKDEDLVTFTKAYSGLTDAEFVEVDRFVKQNTIERFGPVRSVKPELVFEIAFEGIAESPRHKSGIALRFPRMKRWRKDKLVSQANTLDDLKALLKQFG
jgi:DNA ligase-1